MELGHQACMQVPLLHDTVPSSNKPWAMFYSAVWLILYTEAKDLNF